MVCACTDNILQSQQKKSGCISQKGKWPMFRRLLHTSSRLVCLLLLWLVQDASSLPLRHTHTISPSTAHSCVRVCVCARVCMLVCVCVCFFFGVIGCQMGVVEDTVREKLVSHFKPVHLEIVNESFKHNVPKGSETHFKVVIVSSVFEGMPLVQVFVPCSKTRFLPLRPHSNIRAHAHTHASHLLSLMNTCTRTHTRTHTYTCTHALHHLFNRGPVKCTLCWTRKCQTQSMLYQSL